MKAAADSDRPRPSWGRGEAGADARRGPRYQAVVEEVRAQAKVFVRQNFLALQQARPEAGPHAPPDPCSTRTAPRGIYLNNKIDPEIDLKIGPIVETGPHQTASLSRQTPRQTASVCLDRKSVV